MHPGGHQRSLGTTFVKNLFDIAFVKKVSGRVQEGPRSPPDPIKDYLSFRDILYSLTYFFIAYCIASETIGKRYFGKINVPYGQRNPWTKPGLAWPLAPPPSPSKTGGNQAGSGLGPILTHHLYCQSRKVCVSNTMSYSIANSIGNSIGHKKVC